MLLFAKIDHFGYAINIFMNFLMIMNKKYFAFSFDDEQEKTILISFNFWYWCTIVVPTISKMYPKTIQNVSKNCPNTKMSPKYLQNLSKALRNMGAGTQCGSTNFCPTFVPC